MGLILSSEAGVLAELLPTASWGISGPMGGGAQWWSWIHINDAVHLLARALRDDSFVGPVNVTSPGAVTQGEFVRTLGKALRRPAFLPTPAWVLRMALGEFSAEVLTSKRVVPDRATASGFEYRFELLPEAFDQLLNQE